MKNRILFVALAVVSVLLAGCQTALVGYKCTAKITPAQEKDFYDVEIRLTRIDTSPSGLAEYTIADPRLSCLLGETAKIMAADEKEDSGFWAEIIVPKFDTGGTAHCTVHLKEKGQTQFFSDFQLTLPQKPSAAGS